MERFYKLCEKHLTGWYSIKITSWTLSAPRLASWFTLSGITAFWYDYLQSTLLLIITFALALISVFGMFYYRIFPSRKAVMTGHQLHAINVVVAILMALTVIFVIYWSTR